jgi:hypothetical protein
MESKSPPKKSTEVKDEEKLLIKKIYKLAETLPWITVGVILLVTIIIICYAIVTN